MQPYLAGLLLGLLHKDGRDLIKIVDLIPHSRDAGFDVVLASGLRLTVTVERAEQPKASMPT